MGGRALKAFANPIVEYMQANLAYEDRIETVFTPPTGEPPFDVVFDLTGEVRINRNDDVSTHRCHPLKFGRSPLSL